MTTQQKINRFVETFTVIFENKACDASTYINAQLHKFIFHFPFKNSKRKYLTTTKVVLQ